MTKRQIQSVFDKRKKESKLIIYLVFFLIQRLSSSY